MDTSRSFLNSYSFFWKKSQKNLQIDKFPCFICQTEDKDSSIYSEFQIPHKGEKIPFQYCTWFSQWEGEPKVKPSSYYDSAFHQNSELAKASLKHTKHILDLIILK